MPATVDRLGEHTRPYVRYEVLYDFREARAILRACSSRCSCANCAQEAPPRSPFRGCLEAMARSTIIRMIAHAIADGFGAGDVAGLSDSLSIERNTSRILISLLGNHVVLWEWWFGLAASVCLGCPIAEFYRLKSTKCQAVAVQYGSFVVAAPWIDLHNNVDVVGSFGFECAQARIYSIDADWAIIRTESTSRSSMGTLDLSEVKLPQHKYHEADVVGVSLQSTIQSANVPIGRNINATYMLATLARIGRYTRIIDPADIFRATSSSHLPRCSHDKSTMPVGAFPRSSRIWTFEEAMGLWEAGGSGAGSSIWTSYTTVLDSYAKYNTLLILSPQGCIVKTADCCFACAQKELDTRFQDSKARRVLSIAIDEEPWIRR